MTRTKKPQQTQQTNNIILFRDCKPLSKDEVLDNEHVNEWLFPDSNSLAQFSQRLIEIAINKLQEDRLQPIDLGFSKQREKDDKILYRPKESFACYSTWAAGRYVGEATIKLTEEDLLTYSKDIQKELKTYIKTPIRLVIHPRFGSPFLCHMLEEIYNFKMPESDTSQAEGHTWNKFYQLILRQLWIAKFAKADKYGLPRQTVKRTHQGMQIRGHLNVRKSIIPFFTKKEVVSEYREKEVDDMIGRIVYKAYDILADKQTGLTGLPPQVKESINDLKTRFQGLQIKITEHDYQSIRYKSIYMSWKPLVDFSWQIIKHRGYNPEQSIDEQGYGLFFDMAEIWEAYIGKIIENEFVHCTEQNSNIRLFENEEEKDFQRIIPDYLSRDWTNEKANAVGDAKYMQLEDKENLQGEQTYSVYYKTIMYMHRFNAKQGFIFYPINSESESEDVWKSDSYKIKGTDTSIVKLGLKIPTQKISEDFIKKASEEFKTKYPEFIRN